MSDVDPRCPQCGAHVRAGADWCSLCYADLRPAPAPPPVPVPEQGSGAEAVAAGAVAAPGAQPTELTAGLGATERAHPRGRHARRAPAYQDGDQPADDVPGADAMLAMLAAESGSPLGGVAGRLGSPGVRVGVMLGGVPLVSLVVFLLMVLLGSLL